jgi:hypothetical protein
MAAGCAHRSYWTRLQLNSERETPKAVRCKSSFLTRLLLMQTRCSLLGLLLAPIIASAGLAQRPRGLLAGCWEFTSGRAALRPTAGGGYGTLPTIMEFTDSLLFAREGDPTYSMRTATRADSAGRWSAGRVGGTWHPHTDSVFAVFYSRRVESGVALRFRIFVDSLEGMARPYTRRTRWEPDVPVSARRVSCLRVGA